MHLRPAGTPVNFAFCEDYMFFEVYLAFSAKFIELPAACNVQKKSYLETLNVNVYKEIIELHVILFFKATCCLKYISSWLRKFLEKSPTGLVVVAMLLFRIQETVSFTGDQCHICFLHNLNNSHTFRQ